MNIFTILEESLLISTNTSCFLHYLYIVAILLFIFLNIIYFSMYDKLTIKCLTLGLFMGIDVLMIVFAGGCIADIICFIIGTLLIIIDCIYLLRNYTFSKLDNKALKDVSSIKGIKKFFGLIYNKSLLIHNYIDESYSLQNSIDYTIQNGIYLSLSKFEIIRYLNNKYYKKMTFERHKVSLFNTNILLGDKLYVKGKDDKKILVAECFETKDSSICLITKLSDVDLEILRRRHPSISKSRYPLFNKDYYMVCVDKSFSTIKFYELLDYLVTSKMNNSNNKEEQSNE